MIELSHQFAKACAAAIRDRRINLGLSQETVAERSGLARSYICDVERGVRNPTLFNLSVIAHALEVDTSQLVLETEIRLVQSLDISSGRPGTSKLDRCIVEYINKRMSHGVIVCDAGGRFVLFNEAAERLLAQGSLPAPLDEWSDAYGCFLPDRVSRYPSRQLPLARSLGGEVVENAAILIRHDQAPDGRMIEATSRPITSTAGKVEGAVVYFQSAGSLD